MEIKSTAAGKSWLAQVLQVCAVQGFALGRREVSSRHRKDLKSQSAQALPVSVGQSEYLSGLEDKDGANMSRFSREQPHCAAFSRDVDLMHQELAESAAQPVNLIYDSVSTRRYMVHNGEDRALLLNMCKRNRRVKVSG